MPASPRALASLLLLALVMSGCGRLPEGGAAAAAGPDPDGPCGPVESPPVQAGSHLIGDTEPPVPYSSTPPTSGWHASGAFDVGVHGDEDPLSEPEQVSVLEAEGAVVTYRDLAPEDVAALADLVEQRYAGRVALTPYPAIDPGQIAVTAWGAVQRCDGLDLDVVDAFLADHVGDDVTPGHGG